MLGTSGTTSGPTTTKTARTAARQPIAAYHDGQLRELLKHIRQGFERLDAGEIDACELDELIDRYPRCA
jgi:hypothetical protein